MEYKKVVDSTKFYFGKQEDYSKFRPGYPKELFSCLVKNYNLQNKTIVELGAGTGKFSKTASSYCNKIYYVEPNLDMINKGKDYCKDCDNIVFVNSCAEETHLEDNVADIIFAVQSFHWFNKPYLKEEVKRVLKPNGHFAIIWNDWEDENNAFGKEYFKYIHEWKIKLTGKSYQHKNVNDRKMMFKDGIYDSYDFKHSKFYTLRMLIGLSKSLSFAPCDEECCSKEFIDGVVDIFNKYQVSNKVCFDFHAKMYIGKV